MKKYVEELASICDGFRLTNTLFTSTKVTQYMLQAARSRNKNLYVVSDLHSKTDAKKAALVRLFNINAIVHDN